MRLPLRWLYVLGLLAYIAYTGELSAQQARPMTRPYADHHIFNWGFHVGMHVEDVILDNIGPTETNPKAWYAYVPSYALGFSVGVVANYNPHLDWSIRLLPTLHFGERKIVYRVGDGEEEYRTLPIRINQVEIPLLVRYSSVRFNDTRPYLIGGGYAAFTIGQKKGDPLLFNLLQGGFTIGLGCDIYLQYFKLSPELRMNFGLTDLIRHQRPDLEAGESMRYTDALKRATGRMILLTFCFE